MQVKLGNSELQHCVKLEKGTRDEFEEAVLSNWANHKLSGLIEAIIKKHGDGQVPKTKKDKIGKAFEVLRGIE